MLIVETCRKTERNRRADMVRLSPRDLQLAELVSRGSQNKEIAVALGLSEGTVKVYLSKLFAKLGLYNRADLSAWAVRHDGMIRSGLDAARQDLGASLDEAPEPNAPPAPPVALPPRSRFWRLYVAP